MKKYTIALIILIACFVFSCLSGRRQSEVRSAGSEARSVVTHDYALRFGVISDTHVGGTASYSTQQWSAFMITPRLQKPTYTQLIGDLKPETDYELRIYAISSLQVLSTQYLSCTFTTM
jgi:hypothetical protein